MAGSTVANSESFQVTIPSDRQIRLTRLFDGPRNLVFEAMTNPRHITRWWGRLGPGYSVPVCEVDLRPGGKWRFINRTPKGELVAFYGEYRDIARPERMVFTEIFEQFPDTQSVVTAAFTEENGKTRLTATVRYPSIEVRDGVLNSGMQKGAATSYDRLEEELGRLTARP